MFMISRLLSTMERQSLPSFWVSISPSANWDSHPCLAHFPGPPCRIGENADGQGLHKPELLNQGGISIRNSPWRRFSLAKGPGPLSKDASHGGPEPARPLDSEKAATSQVHAWHKGLPKWMTRKPTSQFSCSEACTHTINS